MRERTRQALLALVLLAAVGQAARAEDAPELKREVSASPAELKSEPRTFRSLRAWVGLYLGLGGNLELDPERSGLELNDAAKVSLGVQAGAEYLVIKYFAIGGEFRLIWFNSEPADSAGANRSLLVDINVKPRGLYTFERIPLEVYGTVPIGLSVPALSDEFHADTGAGWNIGFGGGVTYFITPMIGANLEGQWVMHFFRADQKDGGPQENATLSQFTLFFNGVFAF